MSTGLESFANPAYIGVLYPFAGSEVIMLVVGVALWVIWHIWEIGFEAREHDKAIRRAREAGIK
ncbi:MAG: hypothetical protein EXQ94_06390 [Alphaproteobacteria bacterium]|nr:hypothetical protein [Alphaproteobacteria bacterium]